MILLVLQIFGKNILKRNGSIQKLDWLPRLLFDRREKMVRKTIVFLTWLTDNFCDLSFLEVKNFVRCN
jgi:hypothetical protein